MGLGTRVEVWYGTIPMYVDTLVGDQLCKVQAHSKTISVEQQQKQNKPK